MRRFDVVAPDGGPIGTLTQRLGWAIRDREGREIARAIDPTRLAGRVFRGILNSAADRYVFFTGDREG
ncbi:MAG TPA: hypothetical protein VM737_02755 [Gemmatimonadota bacterium]|nr:hypothetical protein [Gemmatimonadota bacterium]